MSATELLQFSPAQTSSTEAPPWKVLSVEDDPGYQSSLVHALSRIRVDDRPLEILRVNSAVEAARLLPEHPDISVVLLDVVLEQDDAGLRLVHTIRKVICNNQVRIVLLTGQPGVAPETEVMRRFDIDDYWCKSELTVEHLTSVLTGNIRTWERTSQLEHARQGLQLLLDAVQRYSRHQDLNGYLDCIRDTLSALLRSQQGILIAALPENGQRPQVLAAHGCFKPLRHADQQQLDQLACQLHLTSSEGLEYRDNALLLDAGALGSSQRRCRILVSLARPPEPADQKLLQLFGEQLSTSLANLSLYDQLAELAFHDPLLGIANRNAFKRTLDSLTQDQRNQYQLLMLTLRELNEIALHFGEAFCDQVLFAVSDRLQRQLPEQAVLARTDRSSFALLLPPDSDLEAITQTLQLPYRIEGGEHLITLFMALLPLALASERPAAHLLRIAEQTLADGLSTHQRWSVYDPELERQVRERYTQLQELRQALSGNDFRLVFQPKVELTSGRLAGFEALVRWPQPDGSVRMPDSFIPIAEAGGLISELDMEVLHQTLAAQEQLIAAGIRVPLSFNTSSIDLLRPGYFEQMLARIEASSVPPQLLELEITESQAVPEYAQIAAQLTRLMQLGVGVSIDDFGTGYSSLAHISNLTASALKIDRSFTRRLGQSREIEHITEMIIQLGRQLGCTVIAEGIETEQQQQLLLAQGCTLGQGYLYARALSLDEAILWAREHL
ncbi:hypothetical protein GCM10009104_28280 [Marinobacterium maritimum]|uniref:Diguanylate cyclase (GGDEF) domain-containing protein n=1 Tax=Marinobacterium maritimum TaxID=500162 RepID=A0ABP3TFK6_9GAMM